MYTFTSCQTFAGGLDMGMVQSGLTMIHKVEQAGGFGMINCTSNQHLLGPFTHEVGDYQDWSVKRSDILASNPPCSGFSLMTDHKHRGVDAKINACMWTVQQYAARIRPAIVIMESVRQAYTGGHELMTALRSELEKLSGLRYNLYHVMQNAYDLGGVAERPRYFWTAVQEHIPFGVEYPDLDAYPRMYDAIADLEGMSQTWETQPYRRPATWWSEAHARPALMNGTDGHITVREGIPMTRAYDLLDYANELGIGWPHGKCIGDVAKEVYLRTGRLPESWYGQIDRLLKNNFQLGFMQIKRWDPNKPAHVITGAAMNMVLHPYERRMITHRETARIMGFPDDWKIKPMINSSALRMTWGKGVTVQCGRWIGEWCRNALDGNPGSVTGELVKDREWLINQPKRSGRRAMYARLVGSKPYALVG